MGHETRYSQVPYHYVKPLNAGLGFTEQKSVCILKFLIFLRLFHELMHQYQACLYSFECISHGDSKYGHEIPKCLHLVTF